MSTPNTKKAAATNAVATKPEGPIFAAMIATGIGCLALGILTTLAEAFASVKKFLNWNAAVGPLAGKTLLAVLVWIVVWVILHIAYRSKKVDLRKGLIITLVLVGLGLLLTFPIFFQLFEPAAA